MDIFNVARRGINKSDDPKLGCGPNDDLSLNC